MTKTSGPGNDHTLSSETAIEMKESQHTNRTLSFNFIQFHFIIVIIINRITDYDMVAGYFH